MGLVEVVVMILKVFLFYMIKARPRKELLENLHEELSPSKISRMRPFGKLSNIVLKMQELILKIVILHCG
jgi:hypothetical protein